MDTIPWQVTLIPPIQVYTEEESPCTAVEAFLRQNLYFRISNPLNDNTTKADRMINTHRQCRGIYAKVGIEIYTLLR